MNRKDSVINSYNPGDFEARWQDLWERAGTYHASDSSEKPKYYCLDYFPYPSGEGLHVGHCRNYVPTDVISRFKRMRGYNVLHPMGWDAFGEPAEQNAIRRNITPRETTDCNTANYKRQMGLIGTSYDWSREIDSSDPSYYRWTQWMFLKMFHRGLVYRDTNWQWWCPTCATTLSSHEIEGDTCWRGHPGVMKKEIPAWFFKITDYADELIDGLETVDWPEPIKRMQVNWIGRSEGVEIKFGIENNPIASIATFTTRPDTLFGVTFMALAPEHPLVSTCTTTENRSRVDAYIEETRRMSEIDRSMESREVSGVFTGGYAVNPINKDKVPVFIADYVLPTYGSGAVMGVPAHDHRDFRFASKYNLAIRQVINPLEASQNPPGDNLDGAYTGTGVTTDSGVFSGISSQEAGERIAETLESTGMGSRKVQYRMRDWLISRQRYWGTPIPVVHCDHCGIVPVPEEDLPVLLPDMEDFRPDGTGRSPLNRVHEFVNTSCPECDRPAHRETDTMGGFACSSWYFLRFTSPDYHDGPFHPEQMRYWMPVDLYVGGAEHAVLHLLYSRFWTKVLADEGLLPFREPFSRLVNQGQLHGPDGLRMSKSRGNVVIPDDIVSQYGADALRIYGMFMAPFEQNVDWKTDGIQGAWRFMRRVWNLYQSYWDGDSKGILGEDSKLEQELHKTIMAVTQRIESHRFNTMVSVLMEFTNTLYERIRKDKWHTTTFQECLETLLIILAPAAPFICEELWSQTGHNFSVHQEEWPSWDETKAQEEMVEIAIQINGKTRGTIFVGVEVSESEALDIAAATPELKKYLDGSEIQKIIYVPGKILNILTGLPA
jgi:leucyl-tRNA synthetase